MTYWWNGKSAERNWVEIRRASGIGGTLRCPIASEDGSTNPWYDLVATVRPGDVVYHWNANESRFVGQSRVAESPRNRKGHHVVELKRFHPIQKEIGLATLRSNEARIVATRDSLNRAHPGQPLYLPFQFRSDGLRMMSNYFAKMPTDIVRVLFDETGVGEADAAAPPPEDGAAGDGAQADTVKRVFLKPFRAKADTDYLTRTAARVQRRGRKHETLVNEFSTWLTSKGFRVGRNAAVDLGLEDPPVVIEAKIITNWASSIREAVGQLYEYRYFKVTDPRSGLVFLASKEVPADWTDYLERDRKIGVVHPANGRFVLSPLAKRFLQL